MLIAACGKECCLVDKISQVRACKTGCSPRQNVKVGIFANRLAFDVHAQNRDASRDIGLIDDDLTVKATRSQKCPVQNIGAVGCGNDDNALVRRETVHLNKQLIQRLFALIMPAADICTALTTNGINLIDKDYARGIFLCLREEVTNS